MVILLRAIIDWLKNLLGQEQPPIPEPPPEPSPPTPPPPEPPKPKEPVYPSGPVTVKNAKHNELFAPAQCGLDLYIPVSAKGFGGGEGTVYIYKIDSGGNQAHVVYSMPNTEDCCCLVPHNGGLWMVTEGNTGIARFDPGPQGWRLAYKYEGKPKGEFSGFAGAVHKDSFYTALSAQVSVNNVCRLRKWVGKANEMPIVKAWISRVNGAYLDAWAMCSDGERMYVSLSGWARGTQQPFDGENDGIWSSANPDDHTSWVKESHVKAQSFGVSGSGVVLAGGNDGYVYQRVGDRQWTPLQRVADGHYPFISSLAWTPDHSWYCAAETKETVFKWTGAKFEPIKHYPGATQVHVGRWGKRAVAVVIWEYDRFLVEVL